ncbi:sigma-54 interaction domain-containing protein [Peribacillus muralis]|uniref:sigma-54 interaction domain-containing protein n=1 Tax=Peribacillus muralis TaxID=264697 RepID=UPI000710E0CD|nr:sigma 54-interacting transcriptional regulator [Peribacillus muralis]
MKLGISTLPKKWLEEIINLAAECVVVVDCKGTVVYINSAYCEFLETTMEEALGKPVQEVIENTRMHMVAKNGQAEVAVVQPIKGSEMVANRYPLYIDNELVGAVGTVMFRNPQEWLNYSRKIQPLLKELKYYKTKFEKELKSKYRLEDLVGESPEFSEAKRLARRVSSSQSSILLSGESGTGKELFAHAIHQMSPRGHFPFVRVNCASIPENLLESELFGYEEGAFTGAKRGGKKGKFELAQHGTVLLDEIGDMSIHMQSKLLRVLQEKEVERVGGQAPVPVDVRIIAATHRNLEKMVQDGEFRQDLYYRLNVMKIEIPPLRERKEDIILVALKLLIKLEEKFNNQGIELSVEAAELLRNHAWPGNVRELENVLERAVNVLDGKIIRGAHLPLYLQDGNVRPSLAYTQLKSPEVMSHITKTSIQPLREIIASAEKEAIIEALRLTNGNKKLAAEMLKIGKTSLYDKCTSYNIK